MDSTDIITLLPFIIIGGTSVVVMAQIAIHRDYLVTFLLTLAGFIGAFITVPVIYTYQPRQVTTLFIIDSTAAFYMGLILIASFLVSLISYRYIKNYFGYREEYYILLLLATLGSIILVASNHFISFFLGLELLSVSLYVLISFNWRQRERIEAAIKYLILAGTTSAFLLFGIALIYATLGRLDFAGTSIPAGLSSQELSVLLIGWGLLVVGIGFKLAVVPFQLWTPDVYQGAPAPVTGFIASVSKGGVFVLMLRYFHQGLIADSAALWWMFAIISIASMLFGNLLALMQSNIKRILAYSSIAHLGYLLVAFLATGPLAPQAVAFYLVAYFATTLVAFGVITVLSTHEREVESLADYQGMFWRHPWLSIIFAASLLSLAGIPPMAGLVGKIYLAAAGVQSGLWLLLIVLVIGSVIGVFYYLRIVIAMFRHPVEENEGPLPTPSLYPANNVVLAALVLVLVWLGIYPAPVFRVIAHLVTNLK